MPSHSTSSLWKVTSSRRNGAIREGVKHQRVQLVATKFYETPDKEEETPVEEKKTSKKKAK